MIDLDIQRNAIIALIGMYAFLWELWITTEFWFIARAHQAAHATGTVYKLNQAIAFSSVLLYQASSKQKEKVYIK